MKILITISLLTAFVSFGYCQKVWITGPDNTEGTQNVEVGDQVHFIAHFDALGTGAIPVSYSWNVPSNFENLHGPSNIDGSTDGSPNPDPVVYSTTLTTNEIDVIWGDFSDAYDDKVEVTVIYSTPSSGNSYVEDHINVYIYRIIIANNVITVPESIQKCCTEEVQYCDPVLGEQDAWNWTISGGGSASSSNGLHCIDVTPNNTGNITVSVVAARTTNNNGYTRSASKTVTRFDPVLSSIHGFPYVCKGSTLTLSVDDVCGSTAIMWSSATDLFVISGQGTTTATYRPNNLATNGTVVNVIAQAYFPGGCTATSNLDVSIYDSGTPPTPSGNVTLVPVLPEEYDPCNDDNVGWYAIYDGTYANGIITVNPSFLLASPHNHHHGSVSVEVCYRNLCGSGNTCRTYTVYLPEDCVEDPIVNTHPSDTSASKLVSSKDILSQPITPRSTSIKTADAVIYPNPASNSMSIFTNFETEFSLEIYDINGKLVMSTTNDSNFVNLDISDLDQGVYMIRLHNTDKSINKKLSIVK